MIKRREEFRIEFGASGEAGRYASFIHEGVNGTKVSVGSPYSFRSKFANIGAIKKWIDEKPVALRNPETGRFIPKTEKNKDQAAFLIARAIARNGIYPTPYFDLGAGWAYEKMKGQLASALARDAIKILTK